MIQWAFAIVLIAFIVASIIVIFNLWKENRIRQIEQDRIRNLRNTPNRNEEQQQCNH